MFVFFPCSFNIFDGIFGYLLAEPIQKYAVIGNNFTILCETTTNVPFKWNKDGINITEANKRFVLSERKKIILVTT